MLWLWLIGCTMDEPPDMHARCAAPVECGETWVRRCTDETGLAAHWDMAEGHVSLWMPQSCGTR